MKVIMALSPYGIRRGALALLIGTLAIGGVLVGTGCKDGGDANPGGAAGSSNAGQNTGGDGASGMPGTGGASNGGTPGSAGETSVGGSAGGAGGSSGTPASGGRAATGGTAMRPELTDEEASAYTVLKYFEKGGDLSAGLVADNWDPTAGVGDVTSFTATYTVGATGGTHTTVQAAIDAAVAGGGTERRYIEVLAGTYREVVCVPSTAPPITLYSKAEDPADTVIVFDNYSSKPKEVGTPANPCNPNASDAKYGTSGSATFAAYAREFQAKNLTFSNDTNEAMATGGSLQAVALMAQGDKLIFDKVRLLGNQDTLFVKSPNANLVSRAYFKDCYVEGDTDYVFGRGTFVLDGCTFFTTHARTPSGVVLAPATDARNPYGILVINGKFTSEADTTAGSTHLGRAWDESQVDVATYTANVATGIYPNGQATVRNSVIGPHVNPAAPWRSAATTSRPYSSSPGTVPANRLYEHQNTAATP